MTAATSHNPRALGVAPFAMSPRYLSRPERSPTLDNPRLGRPRRRIGTDRWTREPVRGGTWADGEISKAEWLKARGRIEPRLEANRRAFARLTHRDAVADYIGRGDELRTQWDGLNLSRQVAIVKAVLDHATILPAAHPGRRGLDPDRVEPTWRL